jgi:hypothetical protein
VTEQPDQARRPSPAASRGSTRRHRVEGGRNHQVLVRFNDAEYEALAARAASAGVSIQRFLTDGAFAGRRPPAAAPAALIAELAGLRRLTRSLSNNINQIARWLNSGGRPDARITGALDSVQRAMTRLDAVLAWLGAPQPATPERRSAQAESRSPSAERLRPPVPPAPGQRNAHPRAPA